MHGAGKSIKMIKKVDVAIQSYKKPESLIFSLLSLHKVARDSIDTVWINDDQSRNGVIDIYKSDDFKKALHPWKVNVRENEKRMGWWLSFVRGYNPSYLSLSYKIFRGLFNFYKNKNFFVDKHDIRYQWAIDSTDKKFIFLMHDDITFKKNIIKKYLDSFSRMKKPAIVGDLGQCWRCPYQAFGCRPDRILRGFKPSSSWPITRVKNTDHKRACRINEWSALIYVPAAKFIEKKYQVFFGNYDDKSDLGAYWFGCAIKEKYQFDDPIFAHEKDDYYLHWEGGITGHSTWVNQGFGKNNYKNKELRLRLMRDFNFRYNWKQFDES